LRFSAAVKALTKKHPGTRTSVPRQWSGRRPPRRRSWEGLQALFSRRALRFPYGRRPSTIIGSVVCTARGAAVVRAAARPSPITSILCRRNDAERGKLSVAVVAGLKGDEYPAPARKAIARCISPRHHHLLPTQPHSHRRRITPAGVGRRTIHTHTHAPQETHTQSRDAQRAQHTCRGPPCWRHNSPSHLVAQRHDEAQDGVQGVDHVLRDRGGVAAVNNRLGNGQRQAARQGNNLVVAHGAVGAADGALAHGQRRRAALPAHGANAVPGRVGAVGVAQRGVLLVPVRALQQGPGAAAVRLLGDGLDGAVLAAQGACDYGSKPEGRPVGGGGGEGGQGLAARAVGSQANGVCVPLCVCGGGGEGEGAYPHRPSRRGSTASTRGQRRRSHPCRWGSTGRLHRKTPPQTSHGLRTSPHPVPSKPDRYTPCPVTFPLFPQARHPHPHASRTVLLQALASGARLGDGANATVLRVLPVHNGWREGGGRVGLPNARAGLPLAQPARPRSPAARPDPRQRGGSAQACGNKEAPGVRWVGPPRWGGVSAWVARGWTACTPSSTRSQGSGPGRPQPATQQR
jgi:hypothetical protein